MTDKAAKVLALIRQGKRLRDLSTYQQRSLARLIQEGFIKEVSCGECNFCKMGYRSSCRSYDIQPTGAS